MSARNQSDCQNARGTDDEVNRAIQEAEKSSKHFQQIALLNGIVLETEIEIFPGVRLVPFTPLLGKRGEKIPRYVSEWSSTIGIDYFFHKTQFIIDPSELQDEFDLEQFCQALSLVCNSAVQIATVISVKKDEDPFSSVPYRGPTFSHLPRDPAKDADIDESKHLYKLLGGLPLDVRRKLHIPINRWIKSHAEQSAMSDRVIDPEIRPEDIPGSPTTRDVDKMIDLAIVFESLYSSGSSNSSLCWRNRAARYLAESEDCQKRLKAIFKKIYGWRSRAVHGGTLPAADVKIGEESFTPSEFIKQAQDLCRRSILKIVKDPCPRVILNLNREHLKPLLENGRNLRKCKVYLKCRFRFIDNHHWQPHYAIIPSGGISKKGYVKEIWIEYVTESIEINNQNCDIMIPHVYHSRQWIQEFMLDSDDSIRLLPNPDEIVVKYFRDLKDSNDKL